MLLKIGNSVFCIINFLNLFTFLDSKLFFWRIQNDKLLIEILLISSLPIFLWFLVNLFKKKYSKFVIVNFLISIVILFDLLMFLTNTYEWELLKI